MSIDEKLDVRYDNSKQ